MSFELFVSQNPNENTSLYTAKKIERCLNAFGIPTYGVFANPQNGGKEILSEADLREKGLNQTDDRLCFIVKVKDRPDDPENSVPAFDDYTNAAQIDNRYAQADDDVQFVCALYSDLNVLAPGQTTMGKLMGVDAVSGATEFAVTELWTANRS